MICMLSLSVVDCGFEGLLDQTKDHEMGICCFSPKYTDLRIKSKDWLALNQVNVSDLGNMSPLRTVHVVSVS